FPAGSVFFNYQTLMPESKFETPEIADNIEVIKSTPWFANLLYWNADIETGNNPVKLSFKTAENEGEYEIQVRGITSKGVPVYGETIIRVTR
ncbi:MAG TPA: hypothetical protein VE912_09960, partial [Bacteroidales bacterium]|nr:hypothetical protein [Bacteroidales bacterium]